MVEFKCIKTQVDWFTEGDMYLGEVGDYFADYVLLQDNYVGNLNYDGGWLLLAIKGQENKYYINNHEEDWATFEVLE